MQTNNVHHNNDMPGALLTVFLMAGSILLNAFQFVSKFDQEVMGPVMHLLQSGAAFSAMVVALATIYPPFKEGLIEWIDHVRAFFKGLIDKIKKRG